MVISLAQISDVAKLAGVSPATVSRVINGSAKVSEEKAKRVLEAIKATGFKPNEIARSLYKKSSRIIGYIVPSILNIFLNEIGRAIEEEAFEHGYKMILCNSDENPKKEAAYIQMLTAMNADGIIITANNDNLDEEIRNCPLPIVVLDKEASGRYTAVVQSDNYAGGRLATEYLLKCGSKHPVLMRPPQKYSSGRQRFLGYVEVCEEHGIQPLYIDSPFSSNDGLRCSKELLERFPYVDGILAVNDMTVLSLYKVLLMQGRRVPDDIMIVGYDGIELGGLMTPELTTVLQPIEEIGRLSAKIIIDQVADKTPDRQEYILPVKLKVRQTTRPPAGSSDEFGGTGETILKKDGV
ncbi:MAG: LacI family transcriptional regulator [Clostridiales bacterium]|jgi:LacI family transcriptional regulator|nr:LacI family transcriptional regulator [Clostridiales bacterium]